MQREARKKRALRATSRRKSPISLLDTRECQLLEMTPSQNARVVEMRGRHTAGTMECRAARMDGEEHDGRCDASRLGANAKCDVPLITRARQNGFNISRRRRQERARGSARGATATASATTVPKYSAVQNAVRCALPQEKSPPRRRMEKRSAFGRRQAVPRLHI